jgi:hypothetical protein
METQTNEQKNLSHLCYNMEDFNISAENLFSQFLSRNYDKKELKCEVLFPDGKVITNGILQLQRDGMILLTITLHEIRFHDWAGIGTRLEYLKYKILEQKT